MRSCSSCWRWPGSAAVNLYSPTRARETVGWLKREMTTPEGAFAASLDADSEGEEGKFYVWSLKEIRQALGADADNFMLQYDVTAGGNFEGHNILNRLKHLPRSIDSGAGGGVDVAYSKTDAARISMLRGKLLELREKRVRPGLDDKVLADWNGLMIAALVNAGIILEEPGWLAMAQQAFDFIAGNMTQRQPARPFLASRQADRPRSCLGFRRHDPRRARAL